MTAIAPSTLQKFTGILIVPVIVFIFWLGGVTQDVNALADDVKEHEAQAAHTETTIDVATIKADVANMKETIDDVKAEQAAQRRQAAEDKEEILKAIREE